MPNYLRNYVLVTGLIAAVLLLAIVFVDWLSLSFAGVDFAFGISVGVTVVLLAATRIRPVLLTLLLIMAAMVIATLFAVLEVNFYMSFAIMAVMAFASAVLMNGRYRGRTDVPPLLLRTVSMLCPLFGMALLPSLTAGGDSALGAVFWTAVGTALGQAMSMPSSWKTDDGWAHLPSYDDQGRPRT